MRYAKVKKQCNAITNRGVRCTNRRSLRDLCTTHHQCELTGRRLRRVSKANCNILLVDKSVCSIKFAKEYEYHHSINALTTIRGDQMIIDLNKEGKVVAIELIGPDKKCQKGD